MSTQWPDLKNQGYAAYPLKYYDVSGNPLGDLGIALSNGPKMQRFRTQIGICITARTISSHFGYNLGFAVDSLPSTNGYPPLFRDSIISRNYSVNYNAQYAGLSLGETYSIRLGKRFGFTFGVAVKAMYSYAASLYENGNSDHYLYIGTEKDPFGTNNESHAPIAPGSQIYSGYSHSISGAKSSFLFLANLSAGADLRIAAFRKSHHSLWLTQAFYLGEDVMKLSGLQSISRLYFGGSLGLKFVLGR